MTTESLMVGTMMLVLIPFMASAWYLSRKYGNRAPGSVVLLWLLSLIIYYTLLFKLGGEWLEYRFPLQVHKESVCEIKTTYSRKGIN